MGDKDKIMEKPMEMENGSFPLVDITLKSLPDNTNDLSNPGTSASNLQEKPMEMEIGSFPLVDITLKTLPDNTKYDLSNPGTSASTYAVKSQDELTEGNKENIMETGNVRNSNIVRLSTDLFFEELEFDNNNSETQTDTYFDCFESTTVCLAILSSLLDSICFVDFSSDSSDDYIPDSNESDTSLNSKSRKTKRLNKHTAPVTIETSDTEDEQDFWEREGIKNGKKKRPRKSEKERREDRDQRKRLRNTGQAYVTHKGVQIPERKQEVLQPCKRLKCSEKVPESFRKEVFKYYWQLGSYEKRRRFISSCIDLERKKTARLEIKGTRHREYSNKYVLRYLDKQYLVCKNCFLKILNETSKFVQVVRSYMAKSESKLIDDSNRGLNPSYKTISEDRLEQAKRHILSFPAYESHYGRAHTSKMFLSSFLNITTMYELYKNETPDPISKTLYTLIFKAQNLSFKVPKVDTCLKCDTLNAQIKVASGNEKENLEATLSNHQKQAEQMYDEKRSDKSSASDTDKNLMVLTFDLQQCLPTPYLTTSTVYYKRQLWTYNLTIHNCVTNKAVCYMWHEAEGNRGGNEIASCIYHFMMHKVPANIKHIILYSDSCSGQNKNKMVISMFLLAVHNSHVEIIEHKFFVPGHSHMESDTDHALIEKAKKKTNMNIHHPKDWYQLVRSVSKNNKITVEEVTQESFFDFSSLVKGVFVARRMNTDKESFLISEVRAFKYTKKIFPKFMYKCDGDAQYKTVDYARKRKQVPDYTTIPRTYHGPLAIAVEKKEDLMSLLPLIDIHSRQFYIDLKSDKDVPLIDPDLEGYEEDE